MVTKLPDCRLLPVGPVPKCSHASRNWRSGWRPHPVRGHTVQCRWRPPRQVFPVEIVLVPKGKKAAPIMPWQTRPPHREVNIRLQQQHRRDGRLAPIPGNRSWVSRFAGAFFLRAGRTRHLNYFLEMFLKSGSFRVQSQAEYFRSRLPPNWSISAACSGEEYFRTKATLSSFPPQSSPNQSKTLLT